MPIGVVASTHPISEWEPRDKDLKKYLHFDRNVSAAKISRIANDPIAVARHSFFPLIRFFESWTKFRNGGERNKKVRPLRYAARVDAAIYARYRAMLSDLYEAQLLSRGLTEVPVAYRRLPKDGGGNKCNIEIARDVFLFIKNQNDCIVTVVDIKSYFESLDHSRIQHVWESLLGGPLPPDHAAVFKSLTKYAVVDYEKVVNRLRLREVSSAGTRQQRRRRKIDELKFQRHKQICSPEEFRSLVAGSTAGLPSLIQKNGFPFGIPQGTPISDLIANAYLIDFDAEMNEWALANSGIYRRYSDDIIVVVPYKNNSSEFEVKNILQDKIREYGSKLRIQDRKVSVVRFSKGALGTSFIHLFGEASRNGLEYLGFEYNGSNVRIKNSTLSNAWRKMKKQAYGHACSFVKRYRAKGRAWILANYPASFLEMQILRDVTYHQDTGYDTWTFIKYTRRASRAFVGLNAIFSRQTRRYRYYAKAIIHKSLTEALRIHGS